LDKKSNKRATSSEQALKLVRLLNRYLMEGVTTQTLAHESGLSERTIWRLLQLYRDEGLEGLLRKTRSDRGIRKMPEDLRQVIEGLCLRTPRASLSWIHKKVTEYCRKQSLKAPSYGTIRHIYLDLHPHEKVLAHDGERAYKEAFEIIHRMEADRPNEFWQCDHKQLDIFASDFRGRTGKLWLTAIIDDYSRAIPGYYLGIEPPNSMRVALCLRQGIWYKDEPGWPVCGVPEHFYSDHGSDFKSAHIDQVAADLKIQLHNSIVEEPQGRGKIERFFQTVDSMFCPGVLSLPESPLQVEEIDKAFKEWLLEEYMQKVHSETKEPPGERFKSGAVIPRMPNSLQDLDLMLHKVGKPRKVQRDGIRFETFRYFDFALGAYVGEEVAVRYDPRDMAQIYVYADGGFICSAACAELLGRQVTIQEIIRNRRARRRELKMSIEEKLAAADRWLRENRPQEDPPQPIQPVTERKRRRIKRYEHE